MSPGAAALILHGGGPTAVLNASLAGAVEEARRYPEIAAFYGARGGVAGLLQGSFLDLYAQPAGRIEAIARAPASALGSSRAALRPEDYAHALEVLLAREVRYVLVNGGNGTMYGAGQLARAARDAGHELRVIGIPKTIDNDIAATDHTPGYGSCARFFAHAVRDIGADVRALPGRVTVVETLGRNVGWIVAATALARHAEDDPPHLIYLPERPLSEDRLCAGVERVYARLGWAVVAVCEGQFDERGEPFGADLFAPDGFSRRLAANVGHTLAQLIARRTGLRTRSEKPGLLGRACAAYVSAVDRDEARRCGRAAVAAAVAGENAKMVTLIREPGPVYRSTTGLADLEQVAYTERSFPDKWIVEGDVAPAFLDWVRPLAGELAAHARLV